MQLYSIESFNTGTEVLQITLLVFAIFILFTIQTTVPKQYEKKITPKLSAAVCFCCLLLTAMQKHSMPPALVCENIFSWAKIMLFSTVLFWIIRFSFFKHRNAVPSFLYIVILGCALSFVLCLSVNSLLLLFIGLEIYTVSQAFLLGIDKNCLEHRETTIRFLLASAVISAIFLFGLSLCYANFQSIFLSSIKTSEQSITSKFGILLILISILCRLVAAPFHTLYINIFPKCRFPVVIFFNTIAKFFMIFVLMKISSDLLQNGIHCHQPLLYAASIASMAVGGILQFFQQNIKKFIGYISVGNIGFTLIIFATATKAEHFKIGTTYIIAHLVSLVCFMEALRALKKKTTINNFQDANGIGKIYPLLSYSLILSILGVAGFPPFVSFLAKIDIMKLLIVQKDWGLLLASSLFSLACMTCGIKISRNLFFDAVLNFEKDNKKSNSGITIITILIISSIFFIATNESFVY